MYWCRSHEAVLYGSAEGAYREAIR